MVPNGWKNTCADKLCSIITKGTTPPKSEVSNQGKIPFLRVNNLTFNGVIDYSSTMIFVSRESHENFLARSIAYPNDVLMNIVGPPLGKTALLDDTYPEYNLNQAIVFYRLDKNIVNSSYFLSHLNSHKAQQWLQSQSKKTSGQQNLTIAICKELPILLPPMLEQVKIAQVLSTWDKAIEATEKLITNSQAQKKALMQQLLTGKKRLLDENGERFSGKWEKVLLKNLCSIQTGKKDANEGSEKGKYPFFTCAKNHIHSDNHSFDCEAILIAGNGAIGTTHYYNGKFEAYQRTYVLNDFKINIKPLFLLYFLNYWLHIDIQREQQRGAMPYIRVGLLQNFKVSLPPLPEQKKIISVLSCIHQGIKNLEDKLQYLKIEKKALMQQLLTGIRRVKVDN